MFILEVLIKEDALRHLYPNSYSRILPYSIVYKFETKKDVDFFVKESFSKGWLTFEPDSDEDVVMGYVPMSSVISMLCKREEDCFNEN